MVITFFFFNDTATTEIYTLSLHDALPIFGDLNVRHVDRLGGALPLAGHPLLDLLNALILALLIRRQLLLRGGLLLADGLELLDRKSTRLNSSHANISYAVFCLKKIKDIPP